MSANSSITLVDQAGGTKSVASNKNGALPDRPVHHSDVVTIQATKTRPADTTAYAAGDAIGDGTNALFVFDLGAIGVPSGLIVGARLVRDVTTDTSVGFFAEIHDAAPATPPALDNAAAPLLWANRATRRGWVNFAAPLVGVAAGTDCLEYSGLLSNTQGIAFSGTGVVRVILSTLAAFTPAASKNYLIELDVVV